MAAETVLERLRRLNPRLPLFSVTDEAFAAYGRVLPLEDGALYEALRATEIPAEGNVYAASVPALEALDAARALRRRVYGEAEIQMGYCNGRGDTLNAEEYHKCSEVNYSTTGLVLLLARPEDLRGRTLRSADVAGFYLPPRVAVEIYPRVLHFAPCRVEEGGFNCLVALTRGTNAPLSAGPDATAEGEDALLWMNNKWLVCHPDSPQAARGTFAGITGENIRLNA